MSDFRDAVRALDLDLIRRVIELVKEHHDLTGAWLSAEAVFSKLMRGPQ